MNVIGKTTWCAALFVSIAACNSENSETESAPSGMDKAGSRFNDIIASNSERNVYFGELHLHTSWSLDAYGFGNQFIGPDEAYRFAKGEEVDLPGGGRTRITSPLDFAAVVEHSEWLGEMRIILSPDHPQYNNQFALDARASDENFFKTILAAEDSGVRPRDFSGDKGEFAAEMAGTVWQEVQKLTEKHYKPGKFTTLHAFEWTAAPGGNNLHRNVFFRGNNVPALPVSWFEARTVEALWDWMETVGGGEGNVFAIPHNSNMSGGLMFKPNYSDGRPIDGEYSRRRVANEPLFEIIQAKGASESNTTYAPNDEFIDFELVGNVNFVGKVKGSSHSWAREALKNGLKLNKVLGANPFQFGIVAATDQHNGLMGDTDEYDFNGSHGLGDADPQKRLTESMEVFNLTALNPGGLTGVWADANTREDIWDALHRKESFGTSGVRIRVRMFGGFEIKEKVTNGEEFARVGSSKGVPMGGVLRRIEKASAPGFIVRAMKDPMSGNLERIQIVKGWLAMDGKLHERIYDVAWSDERKLGNDRELGPVVSTVDVGTAAYGDETGAVELVGYWADPDFNASEAAFYYARVLEIPTPRWSTYDAVRAGIDIPKGVPATIQERAWTSPIWYYPDSR